MIKIKMRRGSDLLEFRFIGSSSANVYHFPNYFRRAVTMQKFIGCTEDPFIEMKHFSDEGWVLCRA